MFTRRAFAGLVAAGAATGASAVRAQSTAAAQAPSGRQAEAAALRAYAETTHPRGLAAAADPAWRSHWDALTAGADTLSEGAYYGGVLKGLGWFKDGHTTAFPPSTGPFALKAPFEVRAFHDGLYVTAARDDAAPLLGGRITSLNGVSDRDLMKRLVAIWPGNNVAWGHVWGPRMLGSAGGLQAADLTADPGAPVRIEAEVEDRRVTAAVRYKAGSDKDHVKLTRTLSERETWTQEYGRGNYVHPLPRSKTLYVSIDDMADAPGKTFPELTREAFAAMARPGFERIVIDLSRNGGGDNFLGEALRRGLERSRFNRPGGLYVITSPATFSAAQNLTNRLERETWATFVGEPTGGAPNHYGDARPFQGESSGLTAIVSTIPWFDSYPADRRGWVMPDLPVPQTFASWKEGRDLALARVLTHKTTAQIDELADDRVFFFGRPTQKAKWEPWWRA